MQRLERGPIRCGVVGYGGSFNMGRSHLLEMQAAGMIPTAICELDPTRLAVAAEDFPGVARFARIDDMLARSDVELVTLVTPHNVHAPLAIQCLRAGRHVVSEKPLAISSAECDQMIAAADERGLMVTAYHNRHWDGHILQAVEHVVRERSIGEVIRIHIRWGSRQMPRDWWRSDRRISGGILFDWGAHLLEWAFQLMPGSEIAEVTGFAHTGHWAGQTKGDQSWHANPIEDEARAILRMSNGTSIDLTISSLDASDPIHRFEIVGTEGHYNMGLDRWTRTRIRDGVRVVETAVQPKGDPHALYENVHAHLRSHEPLVVDARAARRVVDAIDLAMRSAIEGRSLRPSHSTVTLNRLTSI